MGRLPILTSLLVYCILASLICGPQAWSTPLKQCTTDGCSAFPDGLPNSAIQWLECCIQHDVAYWQGGTHQQRETADQQLRTCVANKGAPVIAEIMFEGVRLGGSPYLPTPYRWGYGWPWPRGYQPLSGSEQQQVSKLLELYGCQEVPRDAPGHDTEQQ